ncbi:MAG TPA: hypothetical protein VFK32_01240 [Tepidiformaceae bacterium]|nr:hypothetical protein [Tepidiformaceae bacterium]
MSGYDQNPFKRSRLSRLLDFFDGATRRAHRVPGSGVVGATEPYPEDITARQRDAQDPGAKPPPKAD